MASVAHGITSAPAGAVQAKPIIAHLRGGPFDGAEFVLFRARPRCARRVHRGWVRRLLRRPPRYAFYEVEETWREDGMDHGHYVFTEVRSHGASDAAQP